jgi:hypothetical protein
MITAVAFSIAYLFGTEASGNLAWHATYKAALTAAKRLDRPLFILFNAGSSSAVRLIGNMPVLSDEIEKALDEGYIRAYMDTETESGRSLADEFTVSVVPTIVVVVPGSDMPAHRSSGTPTTEQLLAVLSRHAPVSTARQTAMVVQRPIASTGQAQAGTNAETSVATTRSYSAPANPASSPVVAASTFVCRT